MQQANRRLQVTLGHLNPEAVGSSDQIITGNETSAATATASNKDRYDCNTEGFTHTFDVARLADIMRGNVTREKRIEMFKLVDKPIMLERTYNLSKEEHRKLVTEQVKYLLGTGEINIAGLKTDPHETLQKLELGSFMDASTGIKLGVQIVLFGGSILNLGTKPHHEKYLKGVHTFDIPGCFGMTELRHGSNVRKLETTSTYDPKTQEFIINTPNDGAVKWWIGNAQTNARVCSVFARLITQEKDYGIHVFVVPLRDENHKTLPGIEIGDCGDKVGLHGVDNGFIKFNNVRVPRENLLNRFGDVMPDGVYKTEITSEGRRFGAVLGELITGRVTLCANSIFIRKVATIIATRYAANRLQFGPPKHGEIPILDYRSHQVRLMPILASCYAYEFPKRVLMEKYILLHTDNVPDDTLAEIHAMSAGMKAVSTWDTQLHLQTLRETCGGHGYSAYNKFGILRDDHDVFQTFEGDNTVLIQQLAGHLLKQFSAQFEGSSQIGSAVILLRRQMGDMFSTRNPLITRIATKKHLTSRDWQLQAFEYRTAKLLETCAFAINANKKKMGFFNAFTDSVPLMVQLGRAYIEQFTLQEYMKAIEKEYKTGNRKVADVMKLMCDVFALSCIHKDVGNFMDLIKSSKARAIGKLLTRLCEEMREHAISLVDALEIPDFIIDAPIGLSKGYYVDHILDYSKKCNPNNHSFTVSGDKRPEANHGGKNGNDEESWDHDVIEIHQK
ncbi:acyl-CoA oxidase [Acrasis kona]|uniref:Acyl-coenzyme A oxidase n=1 Tax=Acrasis kona TaxID=1008807 RepID=A0AAW2ZB42_9EUKA